MYNLNTGTLEEFWRFQSDLDIQEYKDFEKHRRDRQFSVEESPLGALLTLLNFYPGDGTDVDEYFSEEFQGLSGDIWDYLRDYSEADFPSAEAILKKDLGMPAREQQEGPEQQIPFGVPSPKKVAALRYEFLFSDPALLIQGIDGRQLELFISKWYAVQSGEKRWNPSYALPAELRPEVQEFCRTHAVPEILYEFNLFRRRDSPYGSPLLTETFSQVIQTHDSKHGLLYAMTGWNLAECVRLSYEHFGKQK